MEKINQISLILLAAGESSRFGTPKLLLMNKSKILMQHTIDLTQNLGMETVIVLGAFSTEILGQVDTYSGKVVQNKDWQEGLASSVRCGLESALILNPNLEAVILVLCDQPFLTTEILIQMLEKYHTSGKSIVHYHYG